MSISDSRKLPPKRNKNASKKSKKSWRKNTDVDDVEEFLEDKRLEERLGGSFSQRPDNQLFTLDTTIETDDKKRRHTEKPLKCFQHLEITSGVRDPKKGRNPRRTPIQRRNPIVERMEEQLSKKGIVKRKKKEAAECRKKAAEKKESEKLDRSTRRRTEFDFDLWDKPESKIENEWLEKGTESHTLRYTKDYKRKFPEGYRDKTSKLPAIAPPTDGFSYNPSLAAHQSHLWEAAVVEINKEKSKRKIESQTTDMYPREPVTEADIMKEMSEGIVPNDDNEDQEEEEDEDDEIEEIKSGNYKPKTKKQRRKLRESRKSDFKKKSVKETEAKNRDVFRIKSYKKQLDLESRISLEKSGRRLRTQEFRKNYQPLRLGTTKYEEPEIAIKLSDELTGNLRSLKPEGNLLEDRFKSFQKRNVIEPRVGTSGIYKRNKKKRYQKRGYKMDWEK